MLFTSFQQIFSRDSGLHVIGSAEIYLNPDTAFNVSIENLIEILSVFQIAASFPLDSKAYASIVVGCGCRSSSTTIAFLEFFWSAYSYLPPHLVTRSFVPHHLLLKCVCEHLH